MRVIIGFLGILVFFVFQMNYAFFQYGTFAIVKCLLNSICCSESVAPSFCKDNTGGTELSHPELGKILCTTLRRMYFRTLVTLLYVMFCND